MLEQKLEVKTTSKTQYVQPSIRLFSCDDDIVTTSGGDVLWMESWGSSFDQDRNNTFIKGVQ